MRPPRIILPLSRYHVYILNCADGTLYTGITTDIVRRLRSHNSGRGSRYTRSRLPVSIGYLEPARSRKAALRREYEIKMLSRSSKLLLCAEFLARKRHS